MTRITRRIARSVAALALTLLAAPQALRADEAAALKAALAETAAQDWAGAEAAALGAGSVGRDIIEWQVLRAGEGLLGEYEDFLVRRADWPGLPLLKEKGEIAVARSSTPERVVAYFNGEAPETAGGALAYVAALTALGQQGAAREAARKVWVDLSFTAEQQAAMLAAQGAALADLHWARADRLLWDGDRGEARRMLPLLPDDRRALANARLGLQDNEPGVSARIDALPKALASDPGLAFDRFTWRMNKSRYDDAAALILERSSMQGGLGRPEAWAPRRANLARQLMRDGEFSEAYAVAARHGLTGGSDYADLEFLAGFIALRKLNDPASALPHFEALQRAVSTPISLSRALYWQGRAEEALGQKDQAQKDFRAAARHQTSYYGLLASERLGLALDPWILEGSPLPPWQGAGFTKSSVFAAANLLLAAGDRTLAKRFALHLAESLDETELEQLAAWATDRGEPHIALLVAKAAAERGAILPRPYFPVPGMVPEDGLSVSRAFALAISRRESEFDPAARSPANAQGLMQLLPTTAQHMADKLGLPFQAALLTTDPAYNARLGTAYLGQLVEEFGPAVALVASGYNAGPGRPRAWIKSLGDPRSPSVDIVDWVETIPFTETRTYVMRVAEGLVIYRAKLKGQAGPINLTGELTGR